MTNESKQADVRGMVPVAYGVSSINAIDGSVGWDFIADFEQAAHDHINDHIMRFQDEGLEVDEMHVVPLYTHPADCPRCAELEATNRQLNREILSVGDEAEDYAMKLSATESERDKLIQAVADHVTIRAEQHQRIAAPCAKCAEVIKERDEFESCLREIGFLVDFDHNGGLAEKVEKKLAALEAENKQQAALTGSTREGESRSPLGFIIYASNQEQ